MMLWTELRSSKFICFSPKPTVTLFGDRAFKKVIKVK